MTKQTYVIFGIVFIVLVLAGAVFVREKGEESAVTPAPIAQPPVVTPPIITPPTLPTPPTSQTPEGWKTYENKEFGFAFDYPGELRVSEVNEKYVTPYGKQKLLGITSHPGDFTIPFTIDEGLTVQEAIERVKNVFNDYESKKIESLIGNVKAIKLTFLPPKSLTVNTQDVFIFEHPHIKGIIFYVGPYDTVLSYAGNVMLSFRFFP